MFSVGGGGTANESIDHPAVKPQGNSRVNNLGLYSIMTKTFRAYGFVRYISFTEMYIPWYGKTFRIFAPTSPNGAYFQAGIGHSKAADCTERIYGMPLTGQGRGAIFLPHYSDSPKPTERFEYHI